TALELGGERGQRQREVRLARRVIKPGGGNLQYVEGARTEREGGEQTRPVGKAEQRHPVAMLERDISRRERGGNRAVDARQAIHRLTHRLAAIEGEDDLVVALGLVLAGIEPGVPRAGLPVDPAAIHPRLVFAERLELAAFAANTPGDEAELGVAQEGLKRR